MKKLGVSLLFTLCTAIIPLASFADGWPIPRPTPLPRPIPLPTPRCRIDPAASELKFEIIRRSTQFRGTVQITGVVKNLGTNQYVSAPGQQIALLYQDDQIVGRLDFARLAPGATLPIRFTRNWDASSPAEGEFPPQYKIVIAYDPDINIDGNLNNDDCRSGNNRLSRSGSAINALF